MTAVRAFRGGVRRVNDAPLILAGAVLVTLAVALPLSLVLGRTLSSHLGASAAADMALEHANYDWWLEFSAQASGLGSTFTPSVIGFAAVLRNASGLLDNQPVAATIGAITIAWLVVWSFLAGGVLDRYARQRPTFTYGFFGACGRHFWRFLRLGVIAWCAYLVLFGTVHGWILESGFARLTRDTTVERTAFAIRTGGYVVFGTLLALSAMVFDYARVRIVVEDRRSAFGAVIAAVRFIGRHRRKVLGLFLLNAMALLALVAAYGALSPGAPRTDMHMWLVLLLGQAYIVGRHYLKLVVYASETTLFQGLLAHAAYTAAPALVWPESPAVETITNSKAAC